jgi:hypothetical protein
MKVKNRVGVLPRNWERAFGYDGDARYVAFYWTPWATGWRWAPVAR